MSFDEEEVAAWLTDNPDFLVEFLAKSAHSYVDGLGHGKYEKQEKSFTRMAQKLIQGNLRNKKIDYDQLVQNDENEVFTRLVRDIAGELDVDKLCHRILKNVNILTKSDRGSLFLTIGTVESRYLVSKLFDVTQTSTLSETLRNAETEIIIPFGRGIAGQVALNKEEINITEAYNDPRFNQAIDKKTGYRTHSILSLPILDNDGEVIGVAQIINKKEGDHTFTAADIKTFRTYLTFCGIGLEKAQLFEMSMREYHRTQLLLKLERVIFEDQSDLPKLMQKAMYDAQRTLRCQRCSVFLVEDGDQFLDDTKPEKTYNTPDDVKFSSVFQLHGAGSSKIKLPKVANIKPPVLTKICKLVVSKKQTINIPDLIDDRRFANEYCADDRGFMVRSLLTMPIFNSKMYVIGVTQFANKHSGFDKVDEDIIEAFSVFLALGLHNCLMYQHVCKMLAKQKAALGMLSFHASACNDEVEKLCEMDLSVTASWGLSTYEFDDVDLDDLDLCKVVLRIFLNTGYVDMFSIPYEVLCRWCLSVRKNYRPVIYHNWRHAVNVFQSMYTIMYRGKLKQYFMDIEVFALLVACLCHDLDHRGTNNAFQVKAESPLATLYSTSIMENHHFDQCIMILNSDGNNIFMSLEANLYRKALRVLEYNILATDLAVYFQKRGNFIKLIDDKVDFTEEKHKSVLSALMMTMCDLAAICKPWHVQFRTAQLVSAEFFQQGDMERDFLGENPIPMMDRGKQSDLPKMQVGFIDAVCSPVFSIFSRLEPALTPLYTGLLDNRRHWQELDDVGKKK